MWGVAHKEIRLMNRRLETAMKQGCSRHSSSVLRSCRDGYKQQPLLGPRLCLSLPFSPVLGYIKGSLLRQEQS